MRSTCARGVQSFRFMPRPNIVFPSPDNYNHRAVFRRATVDSFFPAVPINLKRSVPLLGPPLRPLPLCLSGSHEVDFVRPFVFAVHTRPRPATNTRVSGNEGENRAADG